MIYDILEFQEYLSHDKGKVSRRKFHDFHDFCPFFWNLTREINVSVNSPKLPSCKMNKNADSWKLNLKIKLAKSLWIEEKMSNFY